jgi:hypothetical protein
MTSKRLSYIFWIVVLGVALFNLHLDLIESNFIHNVFWLVVDLAVGSLSLWKIWKLWMGIL